MCCAKVDRSAAKAWVRSTARPSEPVARPALRLGPLRTSVRGRCAASSRSPAGPAQSSIHQALDARDARGRTVVRGCRRRAGALRDARIERLRVPIRRPSGVSVGLPLAVRRQDRAGIPDPRSVRFRPRLRPRSFGGKGLWHIRGRHRLLPTPAFRRHASTRGARHGASRAVAAIRGGRARTFWSETRCSPNGPGRRSLGWAAIDRGGRHAGRDRAARPRRGLAVRVT